MTEFASRGVGTAGLTTGVIGTALGALAGIGELVMAHQKGRCDGGNESVISSLQSENALLKANIYNDQKLLEVYAYVDGQLKDIRATQSAQAVTNAKIEGTFAVLGEQIHAQRNEFMSALNRERDERCCGDNSIVTYSNATFYPKMVADVTVGTTTTAQAIYNPLPNCGCCR